MEAGTILCSRCGAPIPWDGVAKMIPCPFCKTMVAAHPFGAPPMGPHPAMQSPRGGGGAIALVIVAVVVLVLGVVGVGAVFFMQSTSVSSISVTVPGVPMTASPIPSIAAAKTGPVQLGSFGGEGNGAGQLTDARSIAVDMDENVYVADYDTLRVQKFDSSGKFQWITLVEKDTFAGNKTIFGIATDTKGTLWVARSGDLLKLAVADGKARGKVSGNYDSMSFKWIAIDPVGNIVTTHDARGDTDLLFLDPNGKLKKRIKNKSPSGLAIDGAGNVYWSESMDGTIEVLDPSGNVKSKFGSKKDKHLSSVQSLAIDGKGHIFASTNEGIDVFDQGGAFMKTIEVKIGGAVRDFALSTKNHLFVLGNDKVTEYEVGEL